MKKNRIFKKVSIAMIIFSIVLSGVVLFQLKMYNNSILEIYARQQDQYIKLVLDQINIRESESDVDEKSIKEILGSIDKSEKEYWTLSKNDSIVFVKDVTETDQYRGFSTASYYVSESGKKFLNSLEKNKVHHDFIIQSGKSYIASGTLFEINGTEYKICLLTNQKFVLSNNDFMQAQIIIVISVASMLLMLLVITMIMSGRNDKKQIEIDGLKEQLRTKNISIENIENELRMLNEYDVKNTVFKEKTVDNFMEKLETKDISFIRFETIVFKEKKAYDKFLQRAQWVVGKKALRFEISGINDKYAVMLVFIDHSREEIKNIMQMLAGESDKCLKNGDWNRGDIELKKYCNAYLKEIKENV